MSMDEIIVRVTGLTKKFYNKALKKEVAVLDHVSFDVHAGRLMAVIGPDGAAKTTLLRLICGLMAPDDGNISVKGFDTLTTPQAIHDFVSYMPQRFSLYAELTVRENLDLYASLYGVAPELRPERYRRLLKLSGLEPFTERPAGKLSGGMKQKLGLICVLVRSPELLLLDEPTVGIDPLFRREIWEILHELVATDKLTIVVTTAYMDEAWYCDEVLLLGRQHIMLQGRPRELLNRSAVTCWKVRAPERLPARILQVGLLQDTDCVIDAVPANGAVRFSLKENRSLSDLRLFKEFPELKAVRTEKWLEDELIVMLRKDSSFVSGEISLDYRRDYSLSAETDVEVKNLIRKFGDFTAVNDISFNVHRGEIFGLLGSNGAGKTTIFRMLCGLLPVTGGEILVGGVNLRRAGAKAKGQIGYVAQQFSMYRVLSVRENLSFFGGAYGLYGQELKQRIEEVLQQFGLTEVADRPVDELPGGFQKRLSMAAGLLHWPRILFLDEPTSGIDVSARRIFWQQITALAAGGTTVVVTTHFMEEAEFCDRIVIIDQGRMLAMGTPAEVRQRYAKADSNMDDVFIGIIKGERREA